MERNGIRLLCATDTWNPDQPSSIVDMSTRSKDFEPSQFGLGNNDEKLDRTPRYFRIVPEVNSGQIKVQLLDQTGDQYYIFTEAQLVVYVGQLLPFLIKKVYKADTTATFSIFW